MSNKEKDKEIKSKLKSFLKNPKTAGYSRADVLLELRPEQSVAQRCRTLKDFGEQLDKLSLDEHSISNLYSVTKDLIVANKPAEYRQTTLSFYKKLIQTQYKTLTHMRQVFFSVIQEHDVAEDLKHRLELLDTLTENGKDITNFEEKIFKFMLDWIQDIADANLLRPYLNMLINLIKFKAANLDNDIVVGFVQMACTLSCTVEDDDIGLLCLTILEIVMGYAIFPTDPLPQCVLTLCRTVNHSPYCQESWKIMRNLLGTELGYYSMKMMCNILNDYTLYDDPQLLRGAVFHLNMNIFGSNLVFQVSPMFYASTVLGCFLNALSSRKVIVTFEVILSVRKLITKYKSELSERIWDRICDIMSAIQDNIEYYEKTNVPANELDYLQRSFHENIDCIEQLIQEEGTKLMANLARIYDLIERVCEQRPEGSVLKLIDYRCSKLTATRPQWLQILNEFVRRFYNMSHLSIRLTTIQSLVRIMDLNRSSYEEEILERIVIPHFNQITAEAQVQVRVAVAKALVDFAKHCDTKRCGDLLEILDNVVNRPFEQYNENEQHPLKTESDIADVITAVDGLIEVFAIKLHRLPSAHAIKIFNILLAHLEHHYERPQVFEHLHIVRSKIFNWMLKARANASYHIGYPDASNNDVIKFSHYLAIDSSLPLDGMTHQHQRQHVTSQLTPHEITSSTHFTTISIRRACKIIVKCLELDKEFQVFQLVIRGLPKVLQNKALIQGNDIEALASALFKICNDCKSSHFPLKSEELHALVVPSIAALVIYHQFLQSSHQYNIISILITTISSTQINKNNNNNNIRNLCINTLTTMILEMPDAFMKFLPDILLQISKCPDAPTAAIPVLEFLSIVSSLSNHLFTNFTRTQYAYVFAISFPYTKLDRYDHYTVSLAHHVIAGWFLKCKLELRKNFINYILSNFQSNANEEYSSNIQSNINEDSSNRKRSTSLGSRNSVAARSETDKRPMMNDSFHSELVETCIDFLARHTFSPCSATPKRLPAVDYLLKDGLSQTWLVGHNLVTITTSGCPSGPVRNGLCARCANLGKSPQLLAKYESNLGITATTEVPIASTNPSNVTAAAAEHRYTKNSLQHSSGNESAGSTDLTSSSSSTNTTQRQTSNSSSASLEALSRRGSNPESGADVGGLTAGSSTSLLGNSLSATSVSGASATVSNSMVQQQVCIRSCTGWAEILVRRPTGNISWITRIQNPIANDCFGQELPFSNMVALFLPPSHGGVYGPDFVPASSEDFVEEEILSTAGAEAGAGGVAQNSSRESLSSVPSVMEDRRKAVAKVRALQRQEEISATTAAIDVPKSDAGKRGKEVLSESVSDGEADDENVAFADGKNSKARNPVRRVNSSPEMSSSWRQSFLANKPAPLSQTLGEEQQQQQQLLAQKKKSVQYSKDMRVSCEAIPEEIAGSTPPQAIPAAVAAKQMEESVQHSSSVSSLKKAAAAAEKVANKPPISPGMSPRLDSHTTTTSNATQKSHAAFGSVSQHHQGLAKSSSSGGANEADVPGASDMMRSRARTISVVREVSNGKNPKEVPIGNWRRNHGTTKQANSKQPLNSKLCLNPSFVFMQLYHSGQQHEDVPLKVDSDQCVTLNTLDFTPPYETYNIGVLYVGKGQCNNLMEILRNSYGSTRYVEFLRGTGTLVSLKETNQSNMYVCLEKGGQDGKFAYVWKDDIVQVTFHVATLMPNNLQKDPNCNDKKKHIGNDFVSIVYNESGEEYNLSTVSGQFSYACVIVEPLELNTNRIYVKTRPEISKYVCHQEGKIVSDRSAPLLARQMALHATLASLVYQRVQKKATPYASNWLERLRTIKRLRAKLIGTAKTESTDMGDHTASKKHNSNLSYLDFTKYT